MKKCRMEEKHEFTSGSMDEKVQNGGKAWIYLWKQGWKTCRMEEKHGFMNGRIVENIDEWVDVLLEAWMRTNINESIKRIIKENVDHKLKVQWLHKVWVGLKRKQIESEWTVRLILWRYPTKLLKFSLKIKSEF